MADEVDLTQLQNGNPDMARRDLRGADLSGLDLSGRDFTEAHLEQASARGANFAGAILTGLQTRGMSAPQANFSGVTAQSTVFFGMELREASFRGAKLGRSHFTQTSFKGADLVGADFQKAVINEGCDFTDALVDATTRFDGARVFHPLSRQRAFDFYRVERGVLVRREDAEFVEPPTGPAVSTQAAAPSVSEVPPKYPEAQGTIDVDYRRFNGRVFIGSDLWEFETKWSNAGDGEIHLYSDPHSISGVAVALGQNTVESVTVDHFNRADFTSRARTPRNGEVALLRNVNGFLAAVQIVSVVTGPESQSKTRLVARYRILGDGSTDVGLGRLNTAFSELRLATEAAFASLEAVRPSADLTSEIEGIGHNNPPPEAALTAEDYEAVKATLVEVREATELESSRDLLERSRRKLIEWRGKIVAWAKVRLDQIQEGFFNQLGSTLADPQRLLAAWLVVSGNLTSVIGAIVGALGGA